MAIIDVYLSNIAAAVYGSEMRSNIYNALSEMAAGVVDVAAAVEAFQAAMPDLSTAIPVVELGTMVDGTISVLDLHVSTVRRNAFTYCESLEAVNLPGAVNIGSYAFAYCEMLSSINIPSVESIGQYAFSGCDALSSISLPAVVSIGIGAFKNTGLETAYFLGETVPEIGTAVFSDTSISYIYVLPSLVDAFKTATNWSAYADRITAYEE